ncbi:MAG: protein-disulfide reductase DsbD N-terminal domain-containing protein [Alphaproteobacteria bacterium]|nr:protein-disulfide reductase DsbD N-terminal domain-containing protein [Alphaproteobacteria bacterium]
MLLLLLPVALANEPAADVAPPPPDPAASPITIPLSPDNPGPFRCKVDPFFVVQEGTTGQLSIKLQIDAPEHLLYVDRIGVEAKDAGGLTVGELTLPPGQPHTDPWGGDPRDVYAQDTEFTVAVTAPKGLGDRVDLSLTVFWQGCSAAMCFMPAEQTFSVPVRIKGGG